MNTNISICFSCFLLLLKYAHRDCLAQWIVGKFAHYVSVSKMHKNQSLVIWAYGHIFRYYHEFTTTNEGHFTSLSIFSYGPTSSQRDEIKTKQKQYQNNNRPATSITNLFCLCCFIVYWYIRLCREISDIRSFYLMCGSVDFSAGLNFFNPFKLHQLICLVEIWEVLPTQPSIRQPTIV